MIEPPDYKADKMKPKKPPRKNGVAKKQMPAWKRHTDDYAIDELARLRFAREEDLEAAIDLVWVGELQNMPFALDPNGRDRLVVPQAGIPYFVRAGITFTQEKLVP